MRKRRKSQLLTGEAAGFRALPPVGTPASLAMLTNSPKVWCTNDSRESTRLAISLTFPHVSEGFGPKTLNFWPASVDPSRF